CVPPEPAALALGQPAPDAESLVVLQGVLEALAAHLAAGADLLRLTRRPALFREERLGVGLSAQRALVPVAFLGEPEQDRQVGRADLVEVRAGKVGHDASSSGVGGGIQPI